MIVRTKDGADRLRLTQTSLARQISSGANAEVVVVDDGSSDHPETATLRPPGLPVLGGFGAPAAA